MNDWAASTVIACATLIGWMVTQAQARSRSIMREVKWLREGDVIKDRYIHRLEDALALADLPIPDHPSGWDEHMKIRDY